MKKAKLTRSQDSQLFGVAAGLAEYFDQDVTTVRLLFVLLTLLGGPGLFIYALLALLMPASDKSAPFA